MYKSCNEGLHCVLKNTLAWERKRKGIQWFKKEKSFKNALTQKFKFKDKLLGKRISIFVSTENENLWISSKLIWFDQARPPETMPQMIQHSKQLRQSLADYKLPIQVDSLKFAALFQLF